MTTRHARVNQILYEGQDMVGTPVAQVRLSALRANLLAGSVGIPVIVLYLVLARVFGYRSYRFPPHTADRLDVGGNVAIRLLLYNILP